MPHSQRVYYICPVREYTPTAIICFRATHTLGKWKVAKEENTNMPRSEKFLSRQKIQVYDKPRE